MIAGTVILASALVLLGAAASSTAPEPSSDAPTQGSSPSSTAPVWHDEFDGREGSAPDSSKWWANVGGDGWGNNELQYYTDSTRNAALDGDGNLVITARHDQDDTIDCQGEPCEYTSARLLTEWKFSRQYGRFESRIKVPEGDGLLPAFWLLGDDISRNPWPGSGEIDIMEVLGDDPGTVKGTLHGPGYSGPDAIEFSQDLPDDESFADDFHTYAVEWDRDTITWLVDGEAYGTVHRSDVGTDKWVGNKPYFILLSLAVGGDWPGEPDESTTFPAEMVVDYVRVYE